MTTTVTDHGDRLHVTAPGINQMLDREKLERAWLLRLEHTSKPALAGVLRRDHGFAVDAIVYAVAADALVTAGIFI